MRQAENSLLSLQTRSFSLKDRQQAELAAVWNQDLVVDDLRAQTVTDPSTLLLVEILQVRL
jgi:hypothetical protein